MEVYPKLHTFKVKDKQFLLDTNSGIFYEINEIVYSIVGMINEVSNDEIIDKLSSRYSKQEVIRNLAVINKLIEADELFSKDRYREFKMDILSPVSTLCLNISHDCNLRCTYCFGEKYDQEKKLMSSEVAERSVDFLIKNSKDQTNLSLSFFGGEPLLNFKEIEHTVLYAQAEGNKHGKEFRFHVTTNGTLLNSRIIEFLVKNKFSLIISLDGPKEVNDIMRPFANGKGSYGIICRNIKAVQAMGDALPFTVRSTFTRKHLEVDNLVMHLAGLGIKDISVEPCATTLEDLQIREEDLSELNQHYDLLADKYLGEILAGRYFSFFHLKQMMDQVHSKTSKLVQCGAGQGYMAVGADGRLYPCHRLVGQDEYVIGDVFNGISNQNIQRTFLGAHVRNKEKCMQCWARYICGGGCHAYALMFNKDILQPYEVECELMKHRIELGVYLYASLKHKSPLIFQNIYSEGWKFCQV